MFMSHTKLLDISEPLELWCVNNDCAKRVHFNMTMDGIIENLEKHFWKQF